MKLTMNLYTDPRVFDMAGAAEKLPAIGAEKSEVEDVKGSPPVIEGTNPGRSKSVSTASAGRGFCSAVIGSPASEAGSALNLYSGRDRQPKNRRGSNWKKEPKKGFEPLTPALRKRCSAVELLRRIYLGREF